MGVNQISSIESSWSIYVVFSEYIISSDDYSDSSSPTKSVVPNL